MGLSNGLTIRKESLLVLMSHLRAAGHLHPPSLGTLYKDSIRDFLRDSLGTLEWTLYWDFLMRLSIGALCKGLYGAL